MNFTSNLGLPVTLMRVHIPPKFKATWFRHIGGYMMGGSTRSEVIVEWIGNKTLSDGPEFHGMAL